MTARQALEEEAKKAESEREAEGEDGDHDTRKLKKGDRMRMVMKNKEEGNELFGGGNFKVRRAKRKVGLCVIVWFDFGVVESALVHLCQTYT
jgi:hypothetical protein